MIRPVNVFYGNSWIRTWTIKVDGVVVNLTGASVLLHVKKTFSDVTPLLTFGTSPASGITIPTPTSGKVLLKSAPVLLAPGRYLFDILVTLGDGTKQTYEQNRLTVKPVATKV